MHKCSCRAPDVISNQSAVSLTCMTPFPPKFIARLGEPRKQFHLNSHFVKAHHKHLQQSNVPLAVRQQQTSGDLCILQRSERWLQVDTYMHGPATGHYETGFAWFSSVSEQMLIWFPSFQLATACRPPDKLNACSECLQINKKVRILRPLLQPLPRTTLEWILKENQPAWRL
jgi:hypothetical protein